MSIETLISEINNLENKNLTKDQYDYYEDQYHYYKNKLKELSTCLVHIRNKMEVCEVMKHITENKESKQFDLFIKNIILNKETIGNNNDTISINYQNKIIIKYINVYHHTKNIKQKIEIIKNSKSSKVNKKFEIHINNLIIIGYRDYNKNYDNLIFVFRYYELHEEMDNINKILADDGYDKINFYLIFRVLNNVFEPTGFEESEDVNDYEFPGILYNILTIKDKYKHYKYKWNVECCLNDCDCNKQNI